MEPYDTYTPMMDSFSVPQMVGPMIAVFALLIILELVLKGIALWRAARMNMPGWFTALLIISTAGIFPLLFLVFTNEQYEAFSVLPTTTSAKKNGSGT